MKASHRKSVMVFDHDPGMLMKCDLLLKKRGYEVYVSTHTDDVVQQVNEHQPDLILINNRMPGCKAVISQLNAVKKDPAQVIPIIRFMVKENSTKAAEAVAEVAERLACA